MQNANNISLETLADVCRRERQRGFRTVLSHGCFDLLHVGHLRHFMEAKQHGAMLIVSLTSDRFVGKGPGRPLVDAEARAELIEALGPVDWVYINDHPSSVPVIEALKPDIYAKGPDYAVAEDDESGKITEERLAVEKHGGRLLITGGIKFSSTTLINRVKDLLP